MMSLTLTDFQIPLVRYIAPGGIATGSDGNLWFTENAAGRIGRMTPAGVLTEYALPTVPPPAGSPAGTAGTMPHPTAITAGPDGALWFTVVPGEIGRITTAGVVTEFALPAVPPPAGSAPGTASTPVTPTAIAAGPDGALWFTGVPGEVGRISMTGVVTEFAVPEIPPPAGSKPGTASTLATLNSITAGPDGALWFTGIPGEIGRITTAGVVTEFAVPEIPPPAGSKPGTAGTPATLQDITAGPDGALWFTGVPDKVGRITTRGVISELTVPTSASVGGVSPQPDAISAGPDGNLWCIASVGNGLDTNIGRITPAGVFTFFAVPGNFNSIGDLTPGPDGNLWFTEQEDGQTPGEQPAVGEITPAGVTKLYALPRETTLDPNLGVPANPTVITTGPDGALWFGETGAIGRITTAGAIQQFSLPTPSATPEDITPGPDGAIWFAQQVTDANDDTIYSIGRITTTGTITVYPLAPNSTSAYVTAGPDGNVWFTENLTDLNTDVPTSSEIGWITPQGQIKVLALPKKVETSGLLGNIALGPVGNLWFTMGGDIGRITAKGNVKMFNVFSANKYGSYPPPPPSGIISGPDGKLWYEGTAHGTTGIARVSTSGKLGPVIPDGSFGSNMARLPNGQVWFEEDDSGSGVNALGLASRSGITATQDLPLSGSLSYVLYPNSPSEANGGIALGPDGNLWATSGASGIVRISGLETIAGGLDYRHRPERAPDYDSSSPADPWTNVSGSATPTFAGVAKPGAEVTLWVRKQGANQPVSIGQVQASQSDGSWTLKSQVKLSNGNYAVTATQTGDTGPPTVLYSLTPDPYSEDLTDALVIAATPTAKGKAAHIAKTQAVPRGNAAEHPAVSLPKRVFHS